MAFAGFRARCGSGCGCANGCAIGTGDFSDGATTGWTTSGAWAETGGLFVGTGAGIATFDTVVPLATDAVMVVTQPRKLSSDGTLRVVIAKVGNAYLFTELVISGGVGTLRLGAYDGSTVTYLSAALTLNDVGAELDARSQLCVSWKPRGEREAGTSGVTGTVYPSSYSDISSDWTSESNLGADDGSLAVNTFATPEVGGLLEATGFGITGIPTNARIDGITIGIECQLSPPVGATMEFDTVRVIGPGGKIGDNKAGPTSISSVMTAYGFGGASDDHNANLTATDVMDAQFGVQLGFELLTGATGGEARVDYIRLTVNWSTSDGRLGTLKASYRNTGDDQSYQCVTNTDVSWDAPDESKSGLVIDSGNWDFSTYSLEYLQSESHPACGNCSCAGQCDICIAPPAPSYVIDLDAGGWTANAVNTCVGGCETVQGAYVLDQIGDCEWYYSEYLQCSNLGSVFLLEIGLTLTGTTTAARWELLITIFHQIVPSACQQATFYSDTFDATGDCQLAATLTKNSDGASSGPSCPTAAALCAGALPATVPLEAP